MREENVNGYPEKISIETAHKLIDAMGNAHFMTRNGNFVHSDCGGEIHGYQLTLRYICSSCNKRWSLAEIKRAMSK